MAFTNNRSVSNYVRPSSEADMPQVIATACGALGPCCDYLYDPIHGLEGFGIHDHHLTSLRTGCVSTGAEQPGALLSGFLRWMHPPPERQQSHPRHASHSRCPSPSFAPGGAIE
ncbi:hypothetical protein [Microvirga guangxiensis]|uniref:hypothetical protein n=1 Tax=Microvirga guangxiensis TaxID=549386 RepID=UPI003CC7B074